MQRCSWGFIARSCRLCDVRVAIQPSLMKLHSETLLSTTDSTGWKLSHGLQERCPVAMTQPPDNFTCMTENLHKLTSLSLSHSQPILVLQYFLLFSCTHSLFTPHAFYRHKFSVNTNYLNSCSTCNQDLTDLGRTGDHCGSSWFSSYC